MESITLYGDAQEKLDECRFKLAEAALDNGDPALAESLLDAIVDYRGSVTQLKKVRYQLAEADYEAALYEKALARYLELDGYRNSATRVKQCRYALASAALTAKDYDEAISLFSMLGSYKESKTLLEEAQYQRAMGMKAAGNINGAIAALEKISSRRAKNALTEMAMEEAAKLAEAGDHAAAAERYAAIGTPEAKEKANASRYVLADQLYQAGDYPEAAAAFHALGKYEDAAQRSEESYEAYYGQVAQKARELLDAKDYLGVIRALDGFDLNALSKTYDDLMDVYNEACYQHAEALYRSGKPYDAIPFYQAAGDYRSAASEKLTRRVYLILGEWESATGKTAVFRMDGTCELMGETLHYRISNFSLYTGPDEQNLSITHKVSAIDEKGMSLRDVQDGHDVVYKFSRNGEFRLPEMPMTLAEEPAAASESAETETAAAPEETDAPNN